MGQRFLLSKLVYFIEVVQVSSSSTATGMHLVEVDHTDQFDCPSEQLNTQNNLKDHQREEKQRRMD